MILMAHVGSLGYQQSRSNFFMIWENNSSIPVEILDKIRYSIFNRNKGGGCNGEITYWP